MGLEALFATQSFRYTSHEKSNFGGYLRLSGYEICMGYVAGPTYTSDVRG